MWIGLHSCVLLLRDRSGPQLRILERGQNDNNLHVFGVCICQTTRLFHAIGTAARATRLFTLHILSSKLAIDSP